MLTGFLNKLEYAACAFYTRCMIRSIKEDSEIHKYFQDLVSDEFRHLLYLDHLNGISTPRDYNQFLIYQQKIIDGEDVIGSKRNWPTTLGKIEKNFQLEGIGSRFLVFQKTIGQHRFTKDLDWDSLIAFITVVDCSNHLFYRFLSLFNNKYKPLYIHVKKTSKYKVNKVLVSYWTIKYILCILLFFPIDVIRILIHRKTLFNNSHE